MVDVESLPVDLLEALRELPRADAELDTLRRDRVEVARRFEAHRHLARQGARAAIRYPCPRGLVQSWSPFSVRRYRHPVRWRSR